MLARYGVVTLASMATAVIVVVTGAIGVALPMGARSGPLGSDCRLMAQALHEAGHPYRVISSDQPCDWRRLGFPAAVAFDDFPPGTHAASRTVRRPIYTRRGYRAEVDVGVVLAPLAGEGENCTYYRFWGAWHRAGCEVSWVA